MEKIYLSLIIFLLLSGCASPSYVLHWHEPRKLKHIFNGPQESTPIANVDDVALLYDREQWVVFDQALDDGSAWLNYAVVLKNNSAKSIKIEAPQVHLEDALKNKIFATYEKKDSSDKSLGTVGANTYYRVDVKFHVSASMAHEYGNSSDPVALVVPLGNGKELQQKVWLWKE